MLRSDAEQRIETLRHAFDEDLLVPFVGAGVSMPAGAPDWPTYLKQIQAQLPEHDPMRRLPLTQSDSYPDFADALFAQLRLYDIEPVGVHIDAPGVIHVELASWRVPLYLTTNYHYCAETSTRWEANVSRMRV